MKQNEENSEDMVKSAWRPNVGLEDGQSSV